MLASSPSPRHSRHVHSLLWYPVDICILPCCLHIYFVIHSLFGRLAGAVVSRTNLVLLHIFVMPQTLLGLPPDVLFCIFTRDEIELADMLRLSLVSRAN